MSRKEAPAYPLPGLRAWREKRFLSQGALAKVAGVSLAAIKYLEAGKHPASAATVRKLAQALNTTPEELTASDANTSGQTSE